jgi:hypothetical protein
LDYFSLKKKDLIKQITIRLLCYDSAEGRKTWESLLDNGRYHINSFGAGVPAFGLRGKSSGLHVESGLLIGHATAIWEFTYKKGILAPPGRIFNTIAGSD